MAGRASLITNNPFFSSRSPAGLDLRFLDDDARAVLICARDLAHKGWRLVNHPLYGNFRPHQQPYRSIVLLPFATGRSAPGMPEAQARQNCAGTRTSERPERAPGHGRSGNENREAVLSTAASAAQAPPGDRMRSASAAGRQAPAAFRAWQSPSGVAPVDPESLHFLEQALLLYQSPASKIRQSRPEDLPEIMRRDCALLDYALLKATLDSLL